MKYILSLLLFILAAHFAVFTQEEVAYPCRSGIMTNKIILIHTTGKKLFDGVIYPYAGLFEYYFDVDAAP